MKPKSTARYRVVVVGGGISGLAAAHRLLERASQLHQSINVELLEASQRLGGVIRTIKKKGFLLEGGPDSFISEKPWALNLCQRLGLESHLIGTQQSHRRSFIVHRGKLVPTPEGFYLIAPSQVLPFVRTPIMSFLGKLRMAADLVLPRRKNLSTETDESLAKFVRRRLGQEALDRLAQPMVGGIYAADPEKLSLRATFPRFLEMEQQHRSILLGMWRSREIDKQSPNHRASGPRYGLFLSLDAGMQQMVERLQEKLSPASLHLNSEVISLRQEPHTQQWLIQLRKGHRLTADAVCLALPSHQSATLLQALAPQLAEKLRSIEYTSIATVNLAYSTEDIPSDMDGFGFLVPAIERQSVLACSFSHLKFPGRAPKNRALLRAFLGGALQPEKLDYDDQRMIELVQNNLQDLLGIMRKPLLTWVDRHPKAMAQYGVGHLDHVKQIDAELLKWPQLKLAGNGFTGIGIPDCIRRAEQCADQLLSRLEP